MLVSWDWLSDYLRLDRTPAEVAERLMMAGLNHEATTPVGDDLAIHLEVTSNRPDCLGHIGIAREAAVLLGQELSLPKAAPQPSAAGPAAAALAGVTLECPQLCCRYTARLIRGVRVAPSPNWLAKRLATIGIATINNIVDITNYVLMESGQPLHAFDLERLAGRKIMVREARAGEEFLAINHKSYRLEPGMCVIADAEHAVALGGVMGGANSEIGPATVDVLIESAEFDPQATRTTARKLSLHSDSSYRFERGVDPAGVDWASRRCCELILELAGGALSPGVIDVGRPPIPREPIVLRLAQLPRVLGIDVPVVATRRILAALGAVERRADERLVEVTPPSWRRDLTREIDLIEEVARIHGYDKIPEDVSVPMAPSHRTDRDRVLGKIRQVLTAAGLDEAMTLSAVDEAWSEALSPWSNLPPLRCYTPVLRRADRLRRSLIPSLLGARRTNESLSNPVIELFEIASVYLPSPKPGELPSEEPVLALSSGGSFQQLKGVIEAVLAALQATAELQVSELRGPEPPAHDDRWSLLDAQERCELRVNWRGPSGESSSQLLGYLGRVSAAGLQRFELRRETTVAEVRSSTLEAIANLVPQFAPLPVYPAVERDLNLVVDEQVRWSEIAATVTASAGAHIERLQYLDTWRDNERLGADKKSLLMTLTLRSATGTLTSEEADRVRDAVVAACQERHGAVLRT